MARIPALVATGLVAALLLPAQHADARTTEPAGSEPTITVVTLPAISGTPRWGKQLRVSDGAWNPQPGAVTYQWLRDGAAIGGANAATYTLKLVDFGTRISVKVAAARDGYTKGVAYTSATRPIDHRVAVSKRFTYSLGFRGPIKTSTKAFADQVAASFADPRGWRSAGFAFTRVASGGSFTVVLSAASSVPSFGAACSATWSCRVGRYVILNQNRWLDASPAWNAAHLPLVDYRHLVLNHETGHWLGHGHASCNGAGLPAPVMLPQSKGLGGCRFNPFPLPGERWTTR
jgi:hypothetical protein